MTRLFAATLLICAAGIASGCSTYVENEASLPFEPIYPSAHVTPEGEAPTGGIFKSNGGGLFASDIRARDVGDILTVALNETFAATKAQTAASAKNDAFGVTLPTGLPNLFTGGYDKNAAGLNGHGSFLRGLWVGCTVKLTDRLADGDGDACVRQRQYGDCRPEETDAEQW